MPTLLTKGSLRTLFDKHDTIRNINIVTLRKGNLRNKKVISWNPKSSMQTILINYYAKRIITTLRTIDNLQNKNFSSKFSYYLVRGWTLIL